MELKKYSSYNEHKEMSLLQEIRRVKLNIASDQGLSDQVIKKSPFPDGERPASRGRERSGDPFIASWSRQVRWGATRRENKEVKPYTSKLVVLTTSQKERCKNA